MKNSKGFAHLYVVGILIVVSLAIGYVAFIVANEAKNQLREDGARSSKEAAEAYLEQDGPSKSTVNSSSNKSAVKTPAVNPTKANTSKQIAGNNNPAVAPVVSPTVVPPKTSIDSVRTFFSAIKNGDFVTANALMGTPLANEIASITNTTDTTQALASCKSNTTCNLVLSSFQPPSDGYKITAYTPKTGIAGEQISFPLSKSSPLVASQIGDYNIDIFSEKYAGDVWVIQNIFINGSPISSYF